ncbi:Uncharacterised protein [Mycobacteroides abscessus subsp. abscessus]|nr:Uncharacterised protein [Mycobacteroides abscessus subsp. abscessus]
MAPRVLAYAGLVSLVPAALADPSVLRKYMSASGSRARPAAESAIAAPSRGLISKPSSANWTAGVNKSRHGRVPCSACASCSMRRIPGTPIERPDDRVSGLGAVRLALSIQRR